MEFMREFPDDDGLFSIIFGASVIRKTESTRIVRSAKWNASLSVTSMPHSVRLGRVRLVESIWLRLREHLSQVVYIASSLFYAMYLMASTRCGISAKQLERELGVTYKDRVAHRKSDRHKLMAEDVEAFDGSAPVEMDEAYIGGRRRGRQEAK